MATTAQTIINSAFAMSAANRPAEISTQATELLSRLNALTVEAFGMAHAANPLWAASAQDVAQTAGPPLGWARPSDCMVLLRLNATASTTATGGGSIATGTEIIIVPFNDQALASGSPSVYELGGRFVAVGNTGDPSGGSLSFICAPLPTSVSSLTQNIDSRFPDAYVDLLATGLAVHLAAKDDRDADAQRLASLKGMWQRNFLTYVRNLTVGGQQRFAAFADPRFTVAGSPRPEED